MDKTKDSQLVRDWLKNEIKQINSTVLSAEGKEISIEQRTKTAMFKIAHIWLGDLKWKEDETIKNMGFPA